MFAADLQPPEKKPRTEGSGDAVEENQAGYGELVTAMAKLLLVHEGERRAPARDANFVLEIKEKSEFQEVLETAVAHYDATGKIERAKEDFKGHPDGKRPDAFFRSIFFRLHQLVEKNQTVVDQKVSQMQPEIQLGAQQALSKLKLCGGKAATDEGKKLRATRCFKLEADENGVVKWIFALEGEPYVKDIFLALRRTEVLEVLGVRLTYDFAPQHKQAKKIQELAFGNGSGRRRRPKKK
ncbi:unnamed protein product [Prorocentrum cordatum]|uniref:Uncharacterized protein n=1 Tax=Prorocentrum cordatum TaxID=2364126 RepID=A0ABN9TYQ3_9DINO|nr:unnamed protein product [Polarella glacialis]